MLAASGGSAWLISCCHPCNATHHKFLELAGCTTINTLLHPEDAMNVQAAEDLGAWLGKVKDMDRDTRACTSTCSSWVTTG